MATSMLNPPSARSALQRLCPEILSEIFLACLDIQPNEPSLTESPVNVSQVCREWRRVALFTPRLWSALSLSRIPLTERASNRSDVRLIKLVAYLNVWLVRSGRVPLSVHFHLRLSERTATYELASATEKFLASLFAHCSRWERVTIVYQSPYSRWSNVTLSNMQKLKSVWLEFSPLDDGEMTRIDFSKSSKLQSLVLCGNFEVDDDTSVLHSLSRVELHPSGVFAPIFPTIDDCLAIMARAPNLSDFSAQCVPLQESADLPPDDAEPAKHHHLAMSNLKMMKMRLGRTRQESVDDIAIFLNRLTLPALESLHVTCHSDIEYTTAGEKLLAMVERSQPPITSLTLDSSNIDEERLLPLLSLLPTLKTLELDHFDFLELTMAALTLRETNRDSAVLCPNLQVIRIKHSFFLFLPTLSEFVVSRWNGPSEAPKAEIAEPFQRSLSEVGVYHCSVREDLTEEAHQAQKDGLLLEMVNSHSLSRPSFHSLQRRATSATPRLVRRPSPAEPVLPRYQANLARRMAHRHNRCAASCCQAPCHPESGRGQSQLSRFRLQECRCGKPEGGGRLLLRRCRLG